MKPRLLTFVLSFFFAIALKAGHETKPLTEKQLKAHKLDGKFFKKGTMLSRPKRRPKAIPNFKPLKVKPMA